MKKVLAVASGGGHWIQLLRLRPSFEHHKVQFITTNKEFQKDVQNKLTAVTDANKWEKLKLVKMFAEVLLVVIRFRPDVIITTGAAPGFAAIFWGKFLGCKTIWIDSIANAGELSESGKRAKKYADVWLTQWKHLETSNGPKFVGSVI